jgi:protein O-mannosyl-transferase
MSSGRTLWLACPALLAIALAIYQPAWHGQAVWDDDGHLTRPELASNQGLRRIWTDIGATQQYYPVVHSVFWIENRVWGHDTFGYHIVSIVLHAISGMLLATILLRLEVPGAVLAAALFVIHPVHVESVSWISEQKNIVSTVFCLASALAYLRFDETRRKAAYVAALVLFVLAVGSKSVTATLPALLLIVFWWKRGRVSLARDVVPLLPFGAIAAAFGALTVWVERNLIGAQGAAFDFTPFERVAIAGRAIWFYLAKLLWPNPLIFNYARWPMRGSDWIQAVYPGLVLAALVALWLVRGRVRGPLAAFLMFIVALSPALGFFNVYPFMYSFVADHFQYLASIPMLALAAAGLVLLARRTARTSLAATALALAVGMPLAAQTWRHSADFTDAETLYRSILTRNPTSTLALNNLGFMLLTRGEHDEAARYLELAAQLEPDVAEHQANMGQLLLTDNRLDEAAPYLEKALQLNPRYADAHANLGVLQMRQGRVDEAMQHLEEAIRLKPSLANAQYTLGLALLGRGRVADARPHLEEAVRLDPSIDGAHTGLCAALRLSGRPNESLRECEAALRLNPSSVDAQYQLGAVFQAMGRITDAMARFRECIRLNPDFAAAHNDLGVLLFGMGKPDEGLAELERAVELNPKAADAQFNLGNAIMSAGRFDEAEAHYRAALAIAPNDPAIHTNLGGALAAQGHFDDAIKEWNEALRIDPGFERAREALNTVGRVR